MADLFGIFDSTFAMSELSHLLLIEINNMSTSSTISKLQEALSVEISENLTRHYLPIGATPEQAVAMIESCYDSVRLSFRFSVTDSTAEETLKMFVKQLATASSRTLLPIVDVEKTKPVNKVQHSFESAFENLALRHIDSSAAALRLRIIRRSPILGYQLSFLYSSALLSTYSPKFIVEETEQLLCDLSKSIFLQRDYVVSICNGLGEEFCSSIESILGQKRRSISY